jgi:GxxExxY protein
MHADDNRPYELSGDVIGCAFAVLDTLGAGFLEKAHEKAPAHEFRKEGLAVAQQRGTAVAHDGTAVDE